MHHNEKQLSEKLIWIVLLTILTACGKQAAALPPETDTLSAPPTPTPTSTLISLIIAPTPIPIQTQTIRPAIAADSIQVGRWQEYEDALAKSLFPLSFIDYEFLCEWEILGRSNQEIYVWTVCMTIASDASTGRPSLHSTMPVVIHIQADGSVESVEIPGGGTHYAADIRRMFPADAAEKYFDGLIHFQELTDHLHWRREHPEEPPLIVLHANPTPSPTPILIPIITLDAIQLERWKEYQTELAKLVLAQHPSQELSFDETALCEWDILGRSNQEVYVWAICSTPDSGGTKPAVMHLELDGSIQEVKVPFHGAGWESTIQKLFPADIQEKIGTYFYSLSSHSGRAEELRMHLLARKTHPEMPPLTILSAMLTATPMP